MDNPTIDDGVCTACNCTVTYDETPQDDEVFIRSKPYCTKPDDEHVDWRATCKYLELCLAEMRAARDAACDIADKQGRKVNTLLLGDDSFDEYTANGARIAELRKVGEP